MIPREYYRRAHAALRAVLAIIAAYSAQSDLVRSGHPVAGALLLVIAGGVLLTALRGTDKDVEPSIARGRMLAVMTGALLVGAALRLWDLASVPEGVWFDEAQNGLVATRILMDWSYKPVYIGGLTQLPTLFFYSMAAWIGLVGPNVLAVRLTAASVGLLTIPGLYLLGRELYGERVGLVAAFLLAVSRWHVNFSRFGMNGITTPFCLVYALYFFARGARTGRRRDFVLGGLFVGIGLNTYLAFGVVPVLLVLWLFHALLVGHARLLRLYWQSVFAAAAVLALTLLPLAIFTLDHGPVFLERARTVSLFTDKTPDQAWTAFLSNVVKHAEMFNYRGDSNGRHNLAGAPELDDGTAALFVLGIIIALARARQPRYSILLLWLVLLLLPAVLSLDFEAPQSYRAIGVIPAVCLLASLPIAGIWTVLRGWLGWKADGALGLLASLGLLVIGYGNSRVYWIEQIHDPASWAAFSTQETIVAREITRLGHGYDVFLDPIFLDQPTIAFLAPGFTDQKPFQPSRDLPFHGDAGAVVFASDLNRSWMDAVHRLYPNARITAFRASATAPAILYEAVIPADAVAALHGLVGSYSEGEGTEVRPLYRRVDPTIDMAWSHEPPLSIPFTVDWTGTLSAPTFGSYRFRLDGPASARLELDRFPVLRGAGETTVVLARGSHALEVTVTLDQPSDVRLSWQPPGGPMQIIPPAMLALPPADNRGLLASYYRGAAWTGPPAFQEIDPAISTYFHLLPLPQPFTVEWTGKISIPRAGIYRFGTQSIDFSWLFIDNRLIVDNSRALDQYVEGAVTLGEGLHDIRIRFLDRSPHSFIDVYWTPPGGERALLPSDVLFPPQGSYPNQVITAAAGATETVGPPPPPPIRTQASGAVPPSPLVLRRVIGQPGAGPGQLTDPRGVAVDRDGNVFIASAGTRRVDEFDAAGRYVRSFGGSLSEPDAVAVDRSGAVMVLDATEGWIYRFAGNGDPLGRFGGPAVGFYHPRGLAVDQSGRVLVADTGTGHITVFDPSGVVLRQVDVRSPSMAHVAQPVGIAVGTDGTIYMTDAANFQVMRFAATFQPQARWPIAAFGSVHGAQLAVAPDGTLYASDPANHRVIHYDRDGHPLDQIEGAELGQPVGVAVDTAGDLYVADAAGGRVLVFGQP
ncbi:MAG: glycosyltransferase family 39 protein [Chloroflexi bacterium]|nr:glycosyltransferase family 39 protein [Chloroflexota bacterium]